MGQIVCFWLTPIEQWEISLRRYSSKTKCSGPYGYHNAHMTLGRGDGPETRKAWEKHGKDEVLGCSCSDAIPHDDPRWPQKCAYCAYLFVAEDNWQYIEQRLFSRSDGGEPCVIDHSNTPVGAMWDADWMGDSHKGPDGIHLVVQTPGGPWPVDGPAYIDKKVHAERGWRRTGVPPKVTATPSIHIPGKYHGWLRDGILIDA